MYRITHGSTQGLADIDSFIDVLNTLDRHPMQAARGLFDRSGELVVARAPGRLDVMGGIADYSGSLVLEMPLREATRVALQRRVDRTLSIVSFGSEADDRDPLFEMPLGAFEPNGHPIEYRAARALFQREPRQHWAAYVAGAFIVLMRECGASFAEGARLLVDSDVPVGKGVSSSAALEVATMRAVCAAYGIDLPPARLAVLCQKVENLVAGAPCGVMDQMTAACGEANRLLSLLCQPAELQGTLEIPDDVAFWGIDSGVRHSVVGADYGSVRVGTFMGYRMIADLARLKATAVQDRQHVTVEDPIWHGYLANMSPSLFESRYAECLPEHISGEEFLERYLGLTDPVTSIDPDHTYAVRAPARHPVNEHFRVCEFASLLRVPPSEQRRVLLGELMYQSHASYSACGLGCEGTDEIVDLVRQAGPVRGLYGAKITGGGSGGTVAVVGRADAGDAVRAVADRYAELTGHPRYVFSGSSPGAAAFGHLRLAPDA